MKPLEVVFRCKGPCGDGQICQHMTFIHGYCKEPALRVTLVKDVDDRKA